MQTILNILLGIPFPHMGEKAIGKSIDIHEIRTLSQFFKYTPLERQGADIPSKVNELEKANQCLRAGQKQGRRHNNAIKSAFNNNKD
jgi:hypothetical protein